MIRLATLAVMALTVSACDTTPRRAPEPERPSPPAITGFGLVGCEVIAEDGSKLRMTILDGPDEMFIRTPSSSMSLPRDTELTDAEIHVAAVGTDGRTVAVTLDQRLEMTVTSIAPDKVRLGHGQCEAI